MTTKNPGKSPPAPPETGPSQQEMQAVYQAHTIAQMLYGQMAATHPWIQQSTPYPGMFDPTMGYPAAQWPQGGPGVWYGYPGYTAPQMPWMGYGGFYGSDVIPR